MEHLDISFGLTRQPYVDPQTGLEYDTNHADKEGWLTKQSEWLKDWRERYMILKGSMLFFSKDQQSPPHGFIDLTECISVRLKATNLEFEVASSTVSFSLRAPTKKFLDEWVAAIRGSISNTLSRQEFKDTYRDLLLQGQMFIKHHHDPVGRFNLSFAKDNSRLVKISPDGQRIIWHKAGQSDVSCEGIMLNTVVAINPGYTTLVFKQTGTKGNDALCFSVVAHERSLDLEAPDRETARKWVEGLRAYIKYGNVLSPAMLAMQEQQMRKKEMEEQSKKGEASKKHEADRAKLRAAREKAHNQLKFGSHLENP